MGEPNFRRNKWKDGSKLFDLEKYHGFRLFVPQRDIQPGKEEAEQVDEGMEKSRKIIFIISRYYDINCSMSKISMRAVGTVSNESAIGFACSMFRKEYGFCLVLYLANDKELVII